MGNHCASGNNMVHWTLSEQSTYPPDIQESWFYNLFTGGVTLIIDLVSKQALRVPEPRVQSTVTRLIRCSQTLTKQHIWEHRETP